MKSRQLTYPLSNKLEINTFKNKHLKLHAAMVSKLLKCPYLLLDRIEHPLSALYISPIPYHRGFSLIEMAVVLCLAGLMMGFIINGTSLYQTAQQKSLVEDFRRLYINIHLYRDQYKALPGDDILADRHLGAPVTSRGNGNNRIDGRWDDTTDSSEAYRVWQHLRLAGLDHGSISLQDAGYIPHNAIGGMVGLQSGTSDNSLAPVVDIQGRAIAGSYVMCMRGVSGRLIVGLDLALDDGDPGTGSILATPDDGNYSLGARAVSLNQHNGTAIQPGDHYIVCAGF